MMRVYRKHKKKVDAEEIIHISGDEQQENWTCSEA
jgi:hypothetical protein